MNDIVKHQDNPVATADFVNRFRSGIAESRASTVIAGGGKPLLRMSKTGDWIYGQSNDEVQEGSRWAVNLYSLQHGWVCWETDGNRILGETMTPVTDPKPAKPAPVSGGEYKEQRAFEARCLDGEDADLEVRYKINSLGGLRAVDTLMGAISRQLAVDPAHPCPVIMLEHDHYPHKIRGRIYIPIFNLVDWCTMTGQLASEITIALPEPEPEPTPPAPPAAAVAQPVPPPKAAKPAKPSLLKPVPSAAAPVAPVATAQLHTGQRRRPSAAR